MEPLREKKVRSLFLSLYFYPNNANKSVSILSEEIVKV